MSTSTAGFIGPTRYGPIDGVPELLTSMADFERIYGGIDQLNFSDKGVVDNYLAHAVRAFFENGGKRLYVSRIYKPDKLDISNSCVGCAYAEISSAPQPSKILLKARYPGVAGKMIVTFQFRVGPNILSVTADGDRILKGANDYDTIWIKSPIESIPESYPGCGEGLYWLERYFDDEKNLYSFKLHTNGKTLPPSSLSSDCEVHIITVDVTVEMQGKFSQPIVFEGLSFYPNHRNALGKVFAKEPHDRSTPPDRSTLLYVPLIFDDSETDDGADIANILLKQNSLKSSMRIIDELNNDHPDGGILTFRKLLKGGSDGDRPGAVQYEGEDGSVDGIKSGLRAFEDIEDISIVAAPGFSYDYKDENIAKVNSILNHLISHCERMRYRIAVLDSANKQLVSDVRRYRGKLDSKYAALYYPWVTILDPFTEKEINLPPSGFVAGIYARNDILYGAHKAPANEIVNLAIGFEFLLNKAQQDVLNPEGINCFRFFEGRGYRLWGARTISSDPEWKYVNLRRYMAFLERSIEKATQWVVFENNSGPLWGNVRQTIEDFLFNEWTSGHLMGDNPKEAYFVRCDRSTMTQNDIDNGRLICLIGVSLIRPAEFVIFRIGQWTADRRS
mgnify:CR=1 FL=1